MSKDKGTCDESKKCCGGNKSVVVVLIVLVVAAIGVLAFMAGKMGDTSSKSNKTSADKVASSDSSGSDASSSSKAVANSDDKVLAVVDGQKITQADVAQMVQGMPEQMRQVPLEKLMPIALEQAISNKVISEKAENSGLERDPEVVKQLEQIKQQLVRAKYVENAVNAEITEDDLKAEYKQYLAKFPDVEEVKASHILVADEAKAKDIIKQLDNGADFAKLAKENSTDGTAKNGGSLGYFTKTDVVPKFADAAFALKVGSYTEKPVKTQFGYHIIKLEDKRKRPPADYETIKPYIKQELSRKMLDKLVKEWRDEATIVRYDENGNPIDEKAEEAKKAEPSAGGADSVEPEASEKAPAASDDASSSSEDDAQ